MYCTCMSVRVVTTMAMLLTLRVYRMHATHLTCWICPGGCHIADIVLQAGALTLHTSLQDSTTLQWHTWTIAIALSLRRYALMGSLVCNIINSNRALCLVCCHASLHMHVALLRHCAYHPQVYSCKQIGMDGVEPADMLLYLWSAL
jgi:hypothetical protein